MKTIAKLELKQSRVRVPNVSALGENFDCPDRVAEIARLLIGDSAQEVVIAFMLNVKNNVSGYVEVARGGVDHCAIDMRQVFRAAVSVSAAAIILAHNHPAGDPKPSREDHDITKRVAECGELLGIVLLDHVIVTDSKSYSFAADGILPSRNIRRSHG